MNRLPFLAVVLLTVFAGACGGHSSSEPVGPDRVSVVSLQPANGSSLVPGSIVTFNARLDYELQSESSGAILLVVQDQNSAPHRGPSGQGCNHAGAGLGDSVGSGQGAGDGSQPGSGLLCHGPTGRLRGTVPLRFAGPTRRDLSSSPLRGAATVGVSVGR